MQQRHTPVLIIDHNEHGMSGPNQRLPIITQYNFDSGQQLALVKDGGAAQDEGPLMELEYYGSHKTKNCDKWENLPIIEHNGNLFFSLLLPSPMITIKHRTAHKNAIKSSFSTHFTNAVETDGWTNLY